MHPRMRYDDAAWEKKRRNRRRLGTPVSGAGCPETQRGAFNISLQMMYKNSSAVIRFSQPGASMFPEEKVYNEVAIMRYIYDQTSIPVPFVLHWGTKDESPLSLSPFIIMEYIEHDTNMYDALNIPGCLRADRGRLDPNISEDKLEFLYGELASILLRLSKLSLPRIGSLAQVDDFSWEVKHRPLSMGLNELVRLGSLPQSELPIPDATIDTASSYFEMLADLHFEHLRYQRNDAIDSADDCRRKFVARHLFRKLARDGQFTKRWKSLDKGSFKIWCDDFRPGNVLLNAESKVVGVVDWEFTYAAPVEFSYAPPWWLLIEKPEYWPKGLADWSTEFERRLRTFLKAMITREDEEIKQGRLQENERLSGPMRESWESGDFWISYVARNSFAFDAIYWTKIDQRFFGRTDSLEDAWKQRLDLLGPKEKGEMEKLVIQKVEEMGARVLAWDPDEYTTSHLNAARKDTAKQTKIGEDDRTRCEIPASTTKTADVSADAVSNKIEELSI